jgi:hypothetical protein
MRERTLKPRSRAAYDLMFVGTQPGTERLQRHHIQGNHLPSEHTAPDTQTTYKDRVETGTFHIPQVQVTPSPGRAAPPLITASKQSYQPLSHSSGRIC